MDVNAEVEGVVQALHFEKGDKVKKGDVLCQIKVNDRRAKLDQARAAGGADAQSSTTSTWSLQKDGFRSKTQVAARRRRSRPHWPGCGRCRSSWQHQIRAPFDGFVDDRYVDVGDYMRVGDKCALHHRALSPSSPSAR